MTTNATRNAAGASRWFRLNLWLHRWASLVATLPFLILCLTGTVLIFHHEIDEALGVVPTVQSAQGAAAQPFAKAVENVLGKFPGERVLSVGADPDEHPGVLLLVTAPNEAGGFRDARLRFAHLATAELTDEASLDADKTLTGFLLDLHARWFLGPLGELVGALIALLVLVSLLSGLVVYAPYVKRIAFGVLRRGRGTRLLQLDLHNFIGALVLGWALVVTVTGALLGLGTVARLIWQQTELTALRDRYAGEPVDARRPPIDVDRVYAATMAALPPGWHVISVLYPRTEFSTDRHYTVLVGGEGLDKRVFRIALVDAADGVVRTVVQLPWYLKAILIAQPLHFGDYGGLALKLLWTACTWLTLFITANGAWLWWDRRRKRRRASPNGASA
jgi:uncharacterized iron-regulated membrane protein